MNPIFKSYDRVIIQDYDCYGTKYSGMRGIVIGLYNTHIIQSEEELYRYTILLDMPIEVEGFGSMKGVTVPEHRLSNAE